MLADEVRFAEVEVKVLGPPLANSSSNSLLPSYPVSIEVPTLVAVNPMEPSSMVNKDLSSRWGNLLLRLYETKTILHMSRQK